jgi:hypothetical protein
MNLEILSNVVANQGFPIALSILLIFRIDKFMQEIVLAQKEGYRQILENTKEIWACPAKCFLFTQGSPH